MNDGAKDALLEGLASVAKALASGRRIEIVDLLAQGERSVEDIATQIGQSVANTSQHLGKLSRAGLVSRRRSGTRIYYSLAGPRVGELQVALRGVACQHVAELDRLVEAYVGDRTTFPIVTRVQLSTQLRRTEVVVMDVRPALEYTVGHVAGAISVPVENLEGQLLHLPTNVAIVAYCRGPYCIYADDVVRHLRKVGYQAARLEDGFPEWIAAGLPVAYGPPTGQPSRS